MKQRFAIHIVLLFSYFFELLVSFCFKMNRGSSSKNSLPEFYLQCGDCLKMFETQEKADNHKSSNACVTTKFQKMACSVCTKILEGPIEYLQHVHNCLGTRRNNIVQKYSCGRCSKIFKSKLICFKHMKNNKCFNNLDKSITRQCHNCSLAFSQKGTLKNHLEQKVCTNEKNMKCFVENCNTYFRKTEHLAQHIRIVHGNNVVFEGSGKMWEVENLKFASPTEFQEWFDSVNHHCKYFTAVVKKIKNVIYSSYKCQYDKKIHNKTVVVPSNRKSIPNYKCPSQISCKTIGEQVMVTFYKTHNHKILNLKQTKIYHSNKGRHPELVEHFIDSENAVISDSDSYLTSVTRTEAIIKTDFNNPSTMMESDGTELGFNNEPLNHLAVESLAHNTVDYLGTRELQIKSNELNVNKVDSSTSVNVSTTCVQNLREYSRRIKHDISILFSNILEYVESSDDSELLNNVKNKLNNVLSDCERNVEMS